MMNGMMTIHPYRGTMIYTVKTYGNFLITSRRLRNIEILEIYTLPSGQISGRPAHLRIER